MSPASLLCLLLLLPLAADARIKRSQSAKVEFKAATPALLTEPPKGRALAMSLITCGL